jgi:hypothetical protein
VRFKKHTSFCTEFRNPSATYALSVPRYNFTAERSGTDEVKEGIQSNRSRAQPRGKKEDDFEYDRQEVMRKKKGN